MATPIFFDAGDNLTKDATDLTEWLDSTCVELDKRVQESGGDPSVLNGVTGVIQHYYTTVHKMGMESERYVREFSKSFAMNAWHILEFYRDQETKAQEAADAEAIQDKSIADVVKELEALKLELAAVKETQVIETTVEDTEESDDDGEPADDDSGKAKPKPKAKK